MKKALLFFFFVLAASGVKAQTNIEMCYAFDIKQFKYDDEWVKIELHGRRGNVRGVIDPQTIATEINRRYKQRGGTKKINIKLLKAQIIAHSGAYLVGKMISCKKLVGHAITMEIRWKEIAPFG